MDRIIKIGPLEIYGKKREVPNEFTRAGDAIENLKRVLEKELKQLMDWLNKWIG